MFRVATIAAAAVSIAAAAPAHSENKPHSRTPIKTIDFYQAAKYRLTLSEVHEIALKVGIPLQAGYGTIGPTSAQRHQAQASAQPRATVIQTAMAQLPQPSTSPSPIDISQASWSDVTQADQPALPGLFDKFGQYIGPRKPELGSYAPELEARSRRMFPGVGQEFARQRWMAAQEQRMIENEINRSKPLLFPVNSR